MFINFNLVNHDGAINHIIDLYSLKNHLMLNKIFGFVLISCTVLLGCKTKPLPINRYSDPSIEIISQLRDARNGAGMVRYLKAKKPIHREAAARAFASIRDTTYLKYLYVTLLTDQ